MEFKSWYTTFKINGNRGDAHSPSTLPDSGRSKVCFIFVINNLLVLNIHTENNSMQSMKIKNNVYSYVHKR